MVRFDISLISTQVKFFATRRASIVSAAFNNQTCTVNTHLPLADQQEEEGEQEEEEHPDVVEEEQRQHIVQQGWLRRLCPQLPCGPLFT